VRFTEINLFGVYVAPESVMDNGVSRPALIGQRNL
jgi:hypothetical protein